MTDNTQANEPDQADDAPASTQPPESPAKKATPISAVERYRRAARRRKFGPPMTVDPAPPLDVDTLWRGLARDGQMRFLVARCTRTVRESVARLGAAAAVSKLMAESMIAALLLRSTLNPGEQLQLIARHEGAVGRIVADIWSAGGMRMTVEKPTVAAHAQDLLGPGALEVARTRGGRSVYRSSVPMRDTIADSVMHFLLASEQIVSVLRLDVAMTGARVDFAGGYLLQMMPEGTHGDLEKLVANLEGLPDLNTGMTDDDPDGRDWSATLVGGFLWDQVARESVEFKCRCSETRVMAMLSTLPPQDLTELIREGNGIETTCEYCRSTYKVSPAQMRSLLSDPS